MTSLKRSLGLISLTFFGVGMILGAGIYSVIGSAAGEAGYSLWISLILSAAVALVTGLSYAELATMYPDAGAEYSYLKKAFPKQSWVAFFIGLIIVTVGAATAATVAIGFSGYLSTFIELPKFWIALALLVIASAINVFGVRESSIANIIFTTIESCGLLLVIYVGLTESSNIPDEIFSWPDLGIFPGAAIIFFSYLGFENIVNLAEEVENPQKNLPRAILISILVTTVLYVGVGIAAVILASPDVLSQSDAPLSTVLEKVSPTLSKVLSFIALFATANTALIALLSASRVLFAMARKADLPKVMAKILSKKGTPWVSALVVLVLATLLLFLGELKSVASFASLASLVGFAAVHITVITLRFKHPKIERPFRVPLTIGKVPVLPIIGVISTVLLMSQFEGMVYLVAAVVLLLTFVVYILRKQKII